jgi:hypothetical protein
VWRFDLDFDFIADDEWLRDHWNAVPKASGRDIASRCVYCSCGCALLFPSLMIMLMMLMMMVIIDTHVCGFCVKKNRESSVITVVVVSLFSLALCSLLFMKALLKPSREKLSLSSHLTLR